MKYYGLTDTGLRRANNEDVFLVDPGLQAAILADGMGGENCGEVGAALTVEAAAGYLGAADPGMALEDLATEAIRSANRRVMEAARERRECRGMGSTIVLALWRFPQLVIANVGDSRAYLYRAGVLRQISYDQNFANELRTRLGFSEERVRSMAHRNILTMAVGVHEEVLVRIHTEALEAGDQILLCSDGLCGPVDDQTIAQILGEPIGIREKVERLVDCANQQGGPDNITAVLLENR